MIISVKTVTAAVILASPLFVTQSDPEPVVFMATSGSHRFTSPEQSRDVWQACGAKAPNGKLVRTFTRKEFRLSAQRHQVQAAVRVGQMGLPAHQGQAPGRLAGRRELPRPGLAQLRGLGHRTDAESTRLRTGVPSEQRHLCLPYAYTNPGREKNKVRARYRPVVVIAAKTKNIITAYPVAQR
ncbi:hypothetical protein ACFSTC_54605 [Nonomuraea ferruginea]